jgi:SAM-dependent methyltransferase
MTEINPWDNWYPKKESVIEPEIPTLVELLKSNNFTRILDLGCGAGRHALYLAKMGFKVYGFDISRDAIAKTKAAFQEEHLHANLQVFDMRKPLPYHDAFFDAVISTRVINHNYLKDIRKLAKEIDRIVRERGYIYLQVGNYPESKRTEKEERKKKGEIEEPEPRTFIPLAGDEKGVPHHDFTRAELDELFPNYVTELIHSESEHYSGFCLILRKIN